MNFIARRKSVAANVATILLLFAIATEKVNINIIRVNGNEEQLHQHHHHQHDNGNGQGEILHFFNGDETESRTEEQEEEEDVLIYFNGINGGFETVEEKAEPETVYEDDDFFIPSPAAPVPKMPTPYKKPYNKHKPKKPVPTPTEHPTPKPSSGPTYRTIPVPYPRSPKPTPNPTPVPTPNPTVSSTKRRNADVTDSLYLIFNFFLTSLIPLNFSRNRLQDPHLPLLDQRDVLRPTLLLGQQTKLLYQHGSLRIRQLRLQV